MKKERALYKIIEVHHDDAYFNSGLIGREGHWEIEPIHTWPDDWQTGHFRVIGEEIRSFFKVKTEPLHAPGSLDYILGMDYKTS